MMPVEPISITYYFYRPNGAKYCIVKTHYWDDDFQWVKFQEDEIYPVDKLTENDIEGWDKGDDIEVPTGDFFIGWSY